MYCVFHLTVRARLFSLPFEVNTAWAEDNHEAMHEPALV